MGRPSMLAALLVLTLCCMATDCQPCHAQKACLRPGCGRSSTTEAQLERLLTPSTVGGAGVSLSLLVFRQVQAVGVGPTGPRALSCKLW